jgi:hypothetical protein
MRMAIRLELRTSKNLGVAASRRINLMKISILVHSSEMWRN